MQGDRKRRPRVVGFAPWYLNQASDGLRPQRVVQTLEVMLMLWVLRQERRRKRFSESLNPGFYGYRVRCARERTSRGRGDRGPSGTQSGPTCQSRAVLCTVDAARLRCRSGRKSNNG